MSYDLSRRTFTICAIKRERRGRIRIGRNRCGCLGHISETTPEPHPILWGEHPIERPRISRISVLALLGLHIKPYLCCFRRDQFTVMAEDYFRRISRLQCHSRIVMQDRQSVRDERMAQAIILPSKTLTKSSRCHLWPLMQANRTKGLLARRQPELEVV